MHSSSLCRMNLPKYAEGLHSHFSDFRTEELKIMAKVQAKSTRRPVKSQRDEGLFERKPGSGVWGVRYFDEVGKERKKSIGTKTAAREYRVKVLEEVRLRKLGLLPSKRQEASLKLTVAQLIDHSIPEFRKNKRPKEAIALGEVWKRELGRNLCRELVPGDIERVLAYLDLKFRPGTVNRYRSFLHRVFRIGLRDGLINDSPMDHGRVRPRKENGRRERVIQPFEEAEISASLSPVDRVLFLLCLYTGLRQGEALSIRSCDVDEVRRILYLPETKSGRPQQTVISPEVLNLLAEAKRRRAETWPDRAWKETDYLFPGPKGAERLCGFALTRRLQKVCKRLGFADVLWHTTRHTFATRLGVGGVDIATLKELTRHSSIQMASHYVHGREDARRKAVEGLSRIGLAQEGENRPPSDVG